MLAWLKNNWLNLLSLITPILLGAYAYISKLHLFIIIIGLLFILIILILIRIYRKHKINKIKEYVSELLDNPEVKIHNKNHKKGYLENMRRILINIVNNDNSLDSQKKAISLLPQLHVGIIDTITFLSELLEDMDKNVDIRRAAAYALGKIDCNDVLKPLVKALEDQDPRIVEVAATSLKDKTCGVDVLWAMVKVLFKNIKTSFSRKVMEAIGDFCERMPTVEVGIIEVMKCLVDYGNDPVAMESALNIIKRAGGAPAVQVLSNLKQRWEPFSTSEIYSKIDQALTDLGEKGY